MLAEVRRILVEARCPECHSIFAVKSEMLPWNFGVRQHLGRQILVHKTTRGSLRDVDTRGTSVYTAGLLPLGTLKGVAVEVMSGKDGRVASAIGNGTASSVLPARAPDCKARYVTSDPAGSPDFPMSSAAGPTPPF